MGQIRPKLLIWNMLKSKKLAATLIFLLAAVSTIGMVNTELDIFQTWWFALLGIVFLVNLTTCTFQQTLNAYRLWCKASSPILGRWGIWGASLFHIGLIAVTVGALISASMKMTGYLRLAEGEVRYELHDYYAHIDEGPFFKESSHRGFGITMLEQQVITKETGEIDEVISVLGIMENGEIVKTTPLGEKEPVIYKGVSIFRREPGFAPKIKILSPDGRKLADTYALFLTERKGDKSRFILEGLPISETAYKLNMEFFPDMVVKGEEVITDRYTLTNPGVLITVMEGPNLVTRKIIKAGEDMEFAGYSIKIGDIIHWNGFEIVNDRGAAYVFVGSWIALAGLVLMYLMPYKKKYS